MKNLTVAEGGLVRATDPVLVISSETEVRLLMDSVPSFVHAPAWTIEYARALLQLFDGLRVLAVDSFSLLPKKYLQFAMYAVLALMCALVGLDLVFVVVCESRSSSTL